MEGSISFKEETGRPRRRRRGRNRERGKMRRGGKREVGEVEMKEVVKERQYRQTEEKVRRSWM